MAFQTKNLISEAKLGKKESLNKLFVKYQNRVLRIVRLRLDKTRRASLQPQSMDIVQDVFLYAFTHIENFEPKSEGHFIHWLSKKVEHIIIDRLRYSHASKRFSEKGEVSIDQINSSSDTTRVQIQLQDDGTTPTQYVVRKEIEQILDSCLEKLNEEDREVIIMRKMEDLTFKEIGDLLEKNEDAARKQYTRAFKKLLQVSEDTITHILPKDFFKR